MAQDIIEEEEDDVVIPESEASVMDMSDEDFAKLPNPTEVVADDTGSTATADSAVSDTGDSADSTDADIPKDGEDSTDDSKTVVEGAAGTADDKAKDKPADTAQDTKPAETLDYKAEYEKLTAPFKANGIDIKVKSTEEILTLMQMGANYHKKMAGLKPSMKIMKLLERHDLLDEGKLGYLIDLNSKNPEAIAKLVRDSGVDPLSIDTSVESTYTPKVARVSDVEMELEAVLEEIKESPAYAKTLKVVSETWDDSSRNAVATNPHIISVINAQIDSGIFDKVSSEVERARRFGKLQGVSDFEAYKQVGDYMHSQGLLVQPVPPAQVNADPANNAQKKADDDKRKAAKKAATATTGKPVVSAKVKSNLLALSDEEFSKLPPSVYTQV